MASVVRILDANANRAREALRVMEEAARFVLDDRDLSGACKALRHDLAAAVQHFGDLAAHRDTPGDVGTSLRTPAEGRRGTVADVALAAGKRLSEALRALEEYGKLVDPAAAAVIEQLRYRGYDIEQRLGRCLEHARARQWRLCVLISEGLCRGGDWRAVARGAIEGGADCLQLREKTLESGELLERARALVALARPRGVSVVVNDRPDVALAADADGVHLGQTDLPCRAARELVGSRLLIGVSTAHLEQAKQAVADGANYCGVGPMFATTTKAKDHIAGPAYMTQFVDALPTLPHLAIGGITAHNAAQVLAAGALGLAVSSAVCIAEDPASATRALREVCDDRATPVK